MSSDGNSAAPEGRSISPARATRESDFERGVKDAPFALLTVDAEGVVRGAEMAVERVFGHEPPAVVGEPLRSLVPSLFSGDAERRWAEWVLDRDYVEVSARHAGGSEVPVALSVRPVDLDPGTIYNVLVRERDDTAEGYRTTQGAMDEVASILAHDLRNPLNVAAGYLALAREEPDDEYVRRAAGAVDRLDRITEDVLTLVREGDAAREPRAVEVASTARAAWESVGGEGGLAVDSSGEILADPAGLRTVLEHLFENAVVHGPADVTVHVGVTDDGFYVADDGPGIPPNDRPHVTQAGHTTVSVRAGLGLAIVDRIVSSHGWGFAIEESGTGGTRVRFTGVGRP